MLFTYPAMLGGAPTGRIVLTSPTLNQVYQRNGSNQASFTVSGTAPYPHTSVQVRAVSITNGTTTAWTTLATYGTPTSGSFSATFSNVLQGWYRLDVRTTYYGQPNGNYSLPTFGVGEIIITSGQSLYANENQTPQVAADPRSLTVTKLGVYSRAADAMPTTSGIVGSIWPIVADALVTQLNLPVVIAATAVGGQTVANWQPGGTDYDTYLKPILQLFPANGARCVLWGQGETDNSNGTSGANYQGTAGVNGLRNIISQSRTDTGWTIPWGINLESDSSGFGATSATITTAQTNVIGDAGNFQVINMDSYNGASYRGFNGPHLITNGQTTVGAAIAASLIAHFGW